MTSDMPWDPHSQDFANAEQLAARQACALRPRETIMPTPKVSEQPKRDSEGDPNPSERSEPRQFISEQSKRDSEGKTYFSETTNRTESENHFKSEHARYYCEPRNIAACNIADDNLLYDRLLATNKLADSPARDIFTGTVQISKDDGN